MSTNRKISIDSSGQAHTKQFAKAIKLQKRKILNSCLVLAAVVLAGAYFLSKDNELMVGLFILIFLIQMAILGVSIKHAIFLVRANELFRIKRELEKRPER